MPSLHANITEIDMGAKIGDMMKAIDMNRVFKVCGISSGSETIPDGWLMDGRGGNMNPELCKKNEGATSVFASQS